MARKPKSGAESGDEKDKDPTKTDESDVQAKDRAAKNELPDIVPPEPPAGAWPEATPSPTKLVESELAMRASRTATVTIAMPVDLGKPPEMPSSSAPPPLTLGSVEDPTHMPGPKDVPAGSPDD